MGWRVGASRLPSLTVMESSWASAVVAFHGTPEPGRCAVKSGPHLHGPVARARRKAGAGRAIASVGDRIERLLELVGVRTLGLGQRLEPVGDLVKAFLARRL